MGSIQAGNTNEIPTINISWRSTTSNYFLNLKASLDISSVGARTSSASRYGGGGILKNGDNLASFVESAASTAMNSPNAKSHSHNLTAATSLADIPLGIDNNNDLNVTDKPSSTAAKQKFYHLRQIFSSNASKKIRDREIIQNIANSNIRKIYERQQRHQQLMQGQGNNQQCLMQNRLSPRQENNTQANQQDISNGMLTSRSQNIHHCKYGYHHSLQENIDEDYQSEVRPYKLWSSRNALLVSQTLEAREKEDNEKEDKIKENENRKGSCDQSFYSMKNKIDKNESLSARSNVSNRHVQNSEVRVFTTPRSQKYNVLTSITNSNKDKDNSEKLPNQFPCHDNHLISPIVKMKINMIESEKMKYRDENFKLIPLNIPISNVGSFSNMKYSTHLGGSGRSYDGSNKIRRISSDDADFISPAIEKSVYLKKNISTAVFSDTKNTINVNNDCKNDRNSYIDNNMNKNSGNNDTNSYDYNNYETNCNNNLSHQYPVTCEDYIYVGSDTYENGDGNGNGNGNSENEVYGRENKDLDMRRNVSMHSRTNAYISPRASKLLAAEGLQKGFKKIFE